MNASSLPVFRVKGSITPSTIALIAALAAAGPALAQVPGQVELGAQQFRQARFQVEARGFIANDETGPDWLASDEVTTIFRTRRQPPHTAVTREVGSVDNGDQESYGEQEKCILPRRTIRNGGESGVLQAPDDAWDCRPDGVTGPIEFVVMMYEGDDYLRFPHCFTGPAAPGQDIEDKDCQDDLIGRKTVSFTAERLLETMDSVGDNFVGVVTLGGPCGPGTDVCGSGPFNWTGPEYSFGYEITRLPDRILSDPPVAPE